MYTRTASYFENSDLKAEGLPSPEELKLLEPFKDKLPPEVFGEAYKPRLVTRWFRALPAQYPRGIETSRR